MAAKPIIFTMDKEKPKDEDPRAKSNLYRFSDHTRAKFDKDNFDFANTQFLIDDHYVGNPPSVQVSIENLNDNIDENFLRKDLTKLGKIRALEIIRNPTNQQHLGLAKVQFEQVSVAQQCVENFNNRQLMGRVLNVYKDLRFARIEEVKKEKLNPRPIIAQTMQQKQLAPILTSSGSLPLPLPIPLPALPVPPTVLQNPNLHPHILPPFHHLQQQQQQLHKPNNSTIPSPHSLDYPITTPSSIMSTPEPKSRVRLEDRIAILMKQPNSLLSTIVTPVAPQASPTYSAFSLNETSYYHSHPPPPTSIGPNYEKYRAELNNHYHRRPDNNNHHPHHQSNHHSYQNHNKAKNKSDRYSPEHNDEDLASKAAKKQLEIELTESQVEDVVLPYSYEKYFKDLSDNLLATLFKKLRENCGFQCLEKAQQAHKSKLDRLKIQRDKEMMEKEQLKQYEQRFMSRSRVDRPIETPRPRVNLTRQRIGDYSMVQENIRRGEVDLRRVNRSSAYVAEPDRRGSHTTSINSDFSDDDESSSTSSSSSASSSSRSSRSSSPTSTSSRSSSLSSRSSISSYSKSSDEDAIPIARPFPEPKNENETNAIEALILLGASETKQLIEDKEDEEIVKPPPKARGRKRKKVADVFESVASEFRAAKRFASDPSEPLTSYDENMENAMHENFYEEKPGARYTFPERSEAEKKMLLDDLLGTLHEKEDIEILREIHERESFKISNEFQIPFGSEDANKNHLNMRRGVLDTQNHPKWWRGCSRCDVIKVSEKQKVQVEEVNYEDLKKAPIKSHVIQAVSTRRDQRGDQRRIAVLNPNIDDKLIKMYTTSTLQMRAKNLRFSRSKIHKWGLFACEKIASGDAVIEYVGEKIRPSLADHREKIVYTNLPTHDGSSYFFRVDYDVIDATLKGNKARFINHSCNPNCFAKVIKHDNGSNSIVIYAKQVIQAEEEITYDYKFPREEGVDKIVCNCRAPNCQKHLN